MELIPIFEIDNTTSAVRSLWDGNAYSNNIFRSSIDAIARNIGKLKGAHYVTDSDNNKFERNQKLNRLLQVEPNPVMTAYDMLYKVATHYFLYNNAFILVDFDGSRRVQGLYPVDCLQAQTLQAQNGTLFISFRMKNGKEYTFPYSDVIHLRRHYNSDQFFGEPNTPINLTLEVAEKQNEGMISSIDNNTSIRGVLNVTQITAEDTLETIRDNFKEDYLSVQNEGGVIVTDPKTEYIPLNQNFSAVDTNQLNTIKNNIYSYLGVSEAIVNSSYTENQWASFYEGVIEPFATQLSLEFTRKIFTEREQAHGNSIQFDARRLMFANAQTKLNTTKFMLQSGLLSVNEARDIMNLPPIEGEEGNKRLVSLNNINSEIMDDYQKNKSEQQ